MRLSPWRSWALLFALGLVACRTQTPAAVSNTATTTDPGEDGALEDDRRGETTTPIEPAAPPPPPIAPPAANAEGCISPEQLSSYSEALAQHAERTRLDFIHEHGLQLVEREGFFLSSEAEPKDDEYEVNGQRFAVVAYMDATEKPLAQLVGANASLQVIEDRSRAHQVQLRVCGVNPCAYGRGARPQVLHLAIRLGPKEHMGEPFVLDYDHWWVFADYTQYRQCAKPPP